MRTVWSIYHFGKGWKFALSKAEALDYLRLREGDVRTTDGVFGMTMVLAPADGKSVAQMSEVPVASDEVPEYVAWEFHIPRHVSLAGVGDSFVFDTTTGGGLVVEEAVGTPCELVDEGRTDRFNIVRVSDGKVVGAVLKLSRVEFF